MNDLVGQRFGRLLVVKKADTQGRTKYICYCDCGNSKAIFAQSLKSGNTKSCGCLNKEKLSERSTVNLVGKRFARLVVAKRLGSKNGYVLWECKCDCGTTINATTKTLNGGMTKSCGCLNSELSSQRAKTTLIKSRDKYFEENYQDNTSTVHLNSEQPRADSETGYRGVSFLPKRKNYVSWIQFRGKKYNLGYYSSAEAAHKAYLVAKSILHDPYLKDGTIIDITPAELRDLVQK